MHTNTGTRTITALTVWGLLLALASPARAVTLPAAAVCPDPGVAQLGTTGDDRLKAGKSAACLLGDEGDDKLKGSKGDDTLDPGPGVDKTSGGAGDDVIIVRGACELGPREILKGGSGDDTLLTPLSPFELEALGVKVKTIEHIVIVPGENDGACSNTDDGIVCTCCNREGFDVADRCLGCAEGFLLREPRDSDGDMEEAALEPTACLAIPTCEDLDCGTRGECLASATHGPTCACEQGWAGEHCEACAPPYELTADGRCALGLGCAKRLCGGHGRCVADADGDLSCDCDPGFETDAECGGPDAVVGGPKAVPPGSGPHGYGVILNNGAHCTGEFSWSVEGGGSVEVDARDSRQAAYTPPTSIVGRIDVATVRAECDNNPELEGRFDVDLVDELAAPDEPAIAGQCNAKLEPFDEALLEWLDQQGIRGATLAVTYQEKLLCLRGYGLRKENAAAADEVMRQCTPMRVASVTKPFTRAAFRGNLFGSSIPAGLGGGTVGENTPLLPLVASTMGLGVNGEVPWQAPAALYGATHPVFLGLGITCSTGDGLINTNWNNVTVNNVLAHTAGMQPNQNYAFAPGTGGCTGNVGEVCGGLGGVGDPTVGTTQRMANDLGLAYGVPTLDDAVAWYAGVCPFDLATAGRFRYSNMGFSVAGKAIENLSGQTYENFVTGFLANDDIIDLDAPGSPIVYQGQSKAGGPAGYTLPSYMPEADYYSPRPDSTDITSAIPDGMGGWTFPSIAAAPYGSRNYDTMGPHGSLVMNALALANFGSEYLIKDGTPRSVDRGGAGKNVYFPTDTGISHSGLLAGTTAMTWELPITVPANGNNANGPGCLVPGDTQDSDDPANGNGLNALAVAPCDVPPGIRVSVIFNGETRPASDPLYFRGRHDWALLSHMLRQAASDVGATAADWDDLDPLGDLARRIGCDVECFIGGCGPWTCGDGAKDAGEECDDGNHEFGDSCEPDCTVPSDEPAGYEDCAGEDPGNCIGGPCAVRDEKFVTDQDRLDSFSAVHPDGDWSPHSYCHDSHTQLAPPWDEATCVRTTHMGKDFDVCRECGVDTMIGCSCPAPNAEDGGCNIDGVSTGLSCVGGRCWDELPPEWMCTADCDEDIYGTGGYCDHDDPKGAVCGNIFCDEPVPGYCGIVHGQVCDIEVDGCANDSCCNPECLDEQDCEDLGYSPGHLCVQERCVLQ